MLETPSTVAVWYAPVHEVDGGSLAQFFLTVEWWSNFYVYMYRSTYLNSYGYGSLPINTILSGMNIHLPAILMFTRGTRFWHTAICHFFHLPAILMFTRDTRFWHTAICHFCQSIFPLSIFPLSIFPLICIFVNRSTVCSSGRSPCRMVPDGTMYGDEDSPTPLNFSCKNGTFPGFWRIP